MPRFHCHFVAEPEAVQAARHRVDDLVELDGRARRVLPLLVSELVTNSVRHASGDSVGLAVEVDDTKVRVEVVDGGGGFAPPAAPAAGEPRASGWGLYLVERIADRWGVSADGRTCVWFEIDRRPSAP